MFGWFRRGKDPVDTAEVEAEMVERRRSERRDVYADVVAMSNAGRFVKKGVALDLSRDGTRVRFQNSDSLLDGMVLNISRYGIKRKARMRWRTRTDVGIEFLDEVE
ncbi:MAG: PilZ domain-containing protein [Pseudomonadota bacterium]